jgi:hypothetical protein
MSHHSSYHQDFQGGKFGSTVKSSANRDGPMVSSPVSNSMMQGNSSFAPYNPTLSSTPGTGSNFTPVKVSNIDYTRPTKNVFPTPFYQEKTKIDENLVVVEDDDEP